MQLLSFESFLGLTVVVVLSATALRMRVIDFGGFLSSIAVGYMVFLGGAWRWLTLLLIFFILGSYSTKFKYEFKASIGFAQEKGGARGWPNIVANGLVAASTGVLEHVALASGLNGNLYAAAYIGAVSTAAADTLATEIGLLSRRSPRLITDLRRVVQPGTSGGVTPLGEAASLLSASLIGFSAAILGIITLPIFIVLLIATISGFLGSTFDSVLGATLQAAYKCRVCGRTTEHGWHHGQPGEIVKGLRLVDNNTVNLLATLFGASASLYMFILLS